MPVLVAMTSTATLPNTADVQSASRIRRFAVRHPVGAYLLLAYPIGWTLRVGLIFVGAPNQLSETAATLVGIAAPAVLITYLGSGRAGVRRLLSGIARWRIGFGRLAFVVGAVPAMTLAVAAATGTLGNPNGGWGKLVLTYLVGLAVGLVATNVWEELAWSGFVQTRLTARRGLFLGAMLTAPLFAAEHLPLVVAVGGPVKMLAVAGTLLAMSVIFRYLIGMVLVDTAGSVLAVGLLHAAFNASGNLSAVHGAWQPMVALVPLTLGMYAYRAIRDRRHRPAMPAWPA
jgi:membrane protease YdiL (CAAX protease family)